MSNAYAHGTASMPLLGATIGQLWRAAVDRHADRPALVCCHQQIRWTYAQLDDQVDRCARALLASNVAPGDRVGIWAPNVAEWVVVQLASALVGAILVNINPAYRSHELGYALRQSGCVMLFRAREHRGVDYGVTLRDAGSTDLREVVTLEDGWASFLARADDCPSADLQARASQLSADDPINIQYTSGTTGSPKGATLSHHNILNNGFFVGELLAYGPDDRICVPVPFYHCFGMVMGTLAAVTHGASIVVPDLTFDPPSTLAAVAGERCTALYGVPTMFIAQLDHAGFETFDLTSLRTGIMAGAPCAVDLMRRVREQMHMTDIAICYGMTETSPVSTQTHADDPVEKRVSSVGRVHPHVEIRVCDPQTGRTLRRGEVGEVCTRGYSVMLGYWDEPEATHAAIDDAGWMHTGDLGVMADDGYLNIVGRSKDMVIRGGENIYPREIEEYLHTHPSVADVQIIGVPDDRYGEELCAWVSLVAGAAADAETLRDYCRAGIARYKVPRYIRIVDEFPLTVTGKVQKFRMREIEIQERGLSAPVTA